MSYTGGSALDTINEVLKAFWVAGWDEHLIRVTVTEEFKSRLEAEINEMKAKNPKLYGKNPYNFEVKWGEYGTLEVAAESRAKK